MELTKLQIKPLSGLTDWPIWKRRIRDFLDYHDGALSVIDGKLLKPEPLAEESTEEQRKQFKEKSDLFRKAMLRRLSLVLLLKRPIKKSWIKKLHEMFGKS